MGGGSSGGSSGAAYYGASTGSSGGGSSGGGHVGPLRRLHDKVHAHMAAKHARHAARWGSSGGGSSGGSSGGYGSSGSYFGASSGGGSSGGSSGGYSSVMRGGSSGGGSSGGHSYGSTYGSRYTPMSNYDSFEAPMSYTPNLESTFAANRMVASDSVAATEVQLMVSVPSNAKVFVNGNATSSQGTSRRFVSRELDPSESYRFEVQVVYDRDGSEVSQTKTVIARSGSSEEVVFDGTESDDPIETILTLNVPTDATVVLANNETKSEGLTRVYRTKQLKTGEAWEDYKIQVTHNGVTKEKTIRLIGGDKLEMTFNFADHQANKLASN
jgi:uncharacterized protein (TIGR03000 family)